MLKILNNIGKLDVENEFEKIFCGREGFLISNVLIDGHYFEMCGEFMYYALKESEQIFGISHQHRKDKIVLALQARKNHGNGVFFHKSFTAGNDTQLRSTSSVIRTLLEAKKDGFLVEQDILETLKYHFSYYFGWNDGIWFCHDTSELKGQVPLSHLKSGAYGKDRRNTATLNTHLDSLTTLLMVINSNSSDFIDYLSNIDKAINSVNNLFEFEKNKSFINKVFQKWDNIFFERYLLNLSDNKIGLFSKTYQKVLHPFFLKLISPTLFFKNGFIGRDLAICNIHVDYLTVNITDFLRLLVVYDYVVQEGKLNLIRLDRESILEKVTKAIDLIEGNNHLKKYIMNNDLQSAWYAEFHYLYSFFNNNYKKIVDDLEMSNIYNLKTTSFAEMAIKLKAENKI